jgi:hypothetical protein
VSLLPVMGIHVSEIPRDKENSRKNNVFAVLESFTGRRSVVPTSQSTPRDRSWLAGF